MEYVVFDYNGTQYKASSGDEVVLPGYIGDEGGKIDFDQVLLLVGEKSVKLGTPYVKGVKISGTVLEHAKGKKLDVLKYKAKSRYRKRVGHRSQYTRVKIGEVSS